jgi:quinol---cytochrome c reductase cytochrome c subunit, bacillus type
MTDEKKNKAEAGFDSNALKNPRRFVFLTRKTSAKVKGDAGKQVMAFPHLLLREAIAFQVLMIALVAVALFWDAPLEQLANPLLTPNPAKAPWYFLGLQELLHYFPPLVAGIIIPTLVVIALVVIPYFNINVQGEPIWAANRTKHLRVFLAALVPIVIFEAAFVAWTVLVPTVFIGALVVYSYFVPPGGPRWSEYLRTRPVSWWVMTWFICVAVVLTVVGTFFRGPGWSWVWPWRAHVG